MNPNKLLPLSCSLVFAILFGLFIQISRSDSSILVEDDEVPIPSIPIEQADQFRSVIQKPQITDAIIPKGQWGRHWGKYMTPKYITIHSTQNWLARANAEGHAELLLSGNMRSVSWHFTVDQSSIYQSLPSNEQARHSDFWGEGDKTSIGIEMCENWGNSRERTTERTCRLVAYLMKTHDIPLTNVVPHHHWRITRSDGVKLGPKSCPHFLMDNGEQGEKWQAFLDKVKAHLPQANNPEIITDPEPIERFEIVAELDAVGEKPKVVAALGIATEPEVLKREDSLKSNLQLVNEKPEAARR